VLGIDPPPSCPLLQQPERWTFFLGHQAALVVEMKLLGDNEAAGRCQVGMWRGQRRPGHLQAPEFMELERRRKAEALVPACACA
jgi:hypothetical protein